MNPPKSASGGIEIKHIHRVTEKKALVVCQASPDYEYLAVLLKQRSHTTLGELRHVGKTAKGHGRGTPANKGKMHTVFALNSNTGIEDSDTIEVQGFQLTLSGNQPELKPLGNPVTHAVKWPFASPYAGAVTIDYPASSSAIPVDGFIAFGTHDQTSPSGKLQGIWLNNLTPDYVYDEEGYWSAQFPMLTEYAVYHLLVVLTDTKSATSTNLTATP